MNRRFAIAFAPFLALAGCGDQGTGGTLVRFHAYAAGLPGTNGSASFETGEGYQVSLTKARLHVGAVYMRLGQTNPGSANSSCYGNTTYGLEVTGSAQCPPGALPPCDFDALSERLQEFSVLGDATTDLDQSAEIWLTGGDVNSTFDTTPIAQVAGTAEKDGVSYDFEGRMTISENRLVPPGNPAEPGTNPICRQRIVVPIPVRIQPEPGGDLALRIDPERWLDSVDFSSIPPSADSSVLEIPDDDTPGPGLDFFHGVTGAAATTYRFSWLTP